MKGPAVQATASKTLVLIALASNLGIALAKFAAATWTQSSAMLSEAVHSLADTSNEVLLMIGLSRAERPPDTQHPFGHGKEIYFWSFIVAMMVFALGAGVATYEGIVKLLDPHPLQNVEVFYVVLAVAFVLEGYSMVRAVREFNRRREKRGPGFFGRCALRKTLRFCPWCSRILPLSRDCSSRFAASWLRISAATTAPTASRRS